MEIQDILTEFGAYYIQGGQNEQRLMTLISQRMDTELLLSTMFTNETKWRAAQATITKLTQPFQKKWTPQGQAKFVPMEIELFKQKIDFEEYPDDLEGSWLGFLSDGNLDRAQWPIVRWLVENLIIPKMRQEFEKEQIFYGRQFDPTVDTPGEPGDTMDGLRYTRNKALMDGKSTAIALGALETDQKLFVRQVEDFTDAINKDYWDESMILGMSQNLFRRYYRGYRELYGKDMDFDGVKLVVDATNITVMGLPSMAGSNILWATPPENTKRLVKNNQNIGRFKIETEDRKVKLFTDFWKGAGFTLGELVFTNELEDGEPEISNLPSVVSTAGETITLNGRDFKGLTGGTYNGNALNNMVITNDRKVTFDVPPTAAGTYTLALTNEFGTTSVNLTAA